MYTHYKQIENEKYQYRSTSISTSTSELIKAFSSSGRRIKKWPLFEMVTWFSLFTSNIVFNTTLSQYEFF